MTGCKSLAYQCANDSECGTGRCEATQFCSFADSSCASGFRYGEHAGNSLGNECVNRSIDAPIGIDAMPDAPDAPPGSITKSFGETGAATHAGVTFDNEMTVGDSNPVVGENHNSVEVAFEMGLWRFDITAIPTSATVISAHLDLETTGDGNIFATGNAQVYRLLQSWDEATMTYFERSAGVTWANVGAGSPGSRDSTVIAAFTPTAEARFMIALPASVVQGWVTTPGTNFGVIVDTAGSAGHLHLATREHVVAAKRPLLVVTYLP